MTAAIVTAEVSGPVRFFDWANRPVGPYDCPQCIDKAVERTLRKENETTFDLSDAPTEPKIYRRYKRQHVHNRDAYVEREDTRVWKKIDNEHHDNLIEGYCCQLDLTSQQSRFARNLYEIVDRQKLGRQSDLAAFSACIHALDADSRTSRKYHPSRKDENNDPLCVAVANNLMQRFALNRRAIASVHQKIAYHYLS